MSLESELNPSERETQKPGLVIPDSDLEKALRALTQHKINYRDRCLSERKILDQANGTFIAGEYLIQIVDSDGVAQEPDSQLVHDPLDILRSNDVSVRQPGSPAEGV